MEILTCTATEHKKRIMHTPKAVVHFHFSLKFTVKLNVYFESGIESSTRPSATECGGGEEQTPEQTQLFLNYCVARLLFSSALCLWRCSSAQPDVHKHKNIAACLNEGWKTTFCQTQEQRIDFFFFCLFFCLVEQLFLALYA